MFDFVAQTEDLNDMIKCAVKISHFRTSTEKK